MPYENMKLPSEYTFSCAPVANSDGTVVMPNYVKWAQWVCTECGHVQSYTHGVTSAYLNMLKNGWNQSGPCPKCGAENAWDWQQIEKLPETKVVLKAADNADKAHSAGSGAAAGGADLTRA